MTKTLNTKDWLSLLNACADEADKVSAHYFNKSSLKIEEKQDNSPVSEADLEVEKIIRTHIVDKHPELGVVGEEFDNTNPDASIKLIIDPIDGTSNFIRGIPIYGTLLAIEKEGEIIAGVVSNGASSERWAAGSELGATYNNHPIHVSKVSTIKESQAFYGSLFGREARGNTDNLIHLLKHSKRQRGIGDFLMHMWVANGHGEFAIDFGLQPWDLAPLGIIVTEAGGQITQVNGDAFSIYEGSILTSNGQFHTELIQLYTRP